MFVLLKHKHLRKKKKFHQWKKWIKKRKVRVNALDLSGSTTKKKYFVCVFFMSISVLFVLKHSRGWGWGGGLCLISLQAKYDICIYLKIYIYSYTCCHFLKRKEAKNYASLKMKSLTIKSWLITITNKNRDEHKISPIIIFYIVLRTVKHKHCLTFYAKSLTLISKTN